MYKKATREKLRFKVLNGTVGLEQIWTLKLSSIKKMIIAQKEVIKKTVSIDDDLSFLNDDSPKVDEIEQLRFDILKDIYVTRNNEVIEAAKAIDKKKHNEKILARLDEIQDEEFKTLSKEDLEKQLIN